MGFLEVTKRKRSYLVVDQQLPGGSYLAVTWRQLPGSRPKKAEQTLVEGAI